jgi:hypothetical protein
MRRTGFITTLILAACGILAALCAPAGARAALWPAQSPTVTSTPISAPPAEPSAGVPADQDNGDDSLFAAAPRLRVTYPLPDDTLYTDAIAQAETNLPPGALVEVEFYLQPEALPRKADEPLIFLGIDRDGDDGWNAPLSLDGLHAARRYRVLALGIDGQGRVLRALSDWFSVRPPGPGTARVISPAPEVVRGDSILWVVAPSVEITPARMDLYLAPVATEPDGPPLASQALPSRHYLGSYATDILSEATSVPLAIPYDSRALPDGLYTPIVDVVDTVGGRHSSLPAPPLRIDHAMAPTVRLLGPAPGSALVDEIELTATVSDPAQAIRRVDFYLEYAQPAMEVDGARAETMHYVHWLGSDTDGSNGWRLRASLSEFGDGDHWHAWAVAYSASGVSGSARSSAPFSIVRDERAVLRLLSPTFARPLRNTERVAVQVVHGLQHVTGVSLYVRDSDGALTEAGEMTAVANQWVLDWDTRTLRDGVYTLVAIARQANEGQALVQSSPLRLENERGLYRLSAPRANETLTGQVNIRLHSTLGAPAIAGVRLYYRDSMGELYPLPRPPDAESGWQTIWDTSDALDGKYELVAHVTNVNGLISTVAQPISIANVTPVVEFSDFDARAPWSDIREIAWRAAHPAGLPLQARIEFSPDGGYHWELLAQSLDAEGTYFWDTRQHPNTRQALLRLTATDGVRHGRAITAPFSVNNVNSAPHVTLLSPHADFTALDRVHVTWQAWDPDGDRLVIDLDYRQGEDEWTTLAHDLTNSGAYIWDTSALPPAEDYALRVTARDSYGATASDSVTHIARAPRAAPTVELVWPNSRIRLDRETVILWEAAGEDDDSLLIDLYYSDNGGLAWLPLAEGLPNTGYYVWQVAFLPPGTQYRIRVVARDGPFQAQDESESAFLVGSTPQPQIALLAPQPTAHITGRQLVRWSSYTFDGAPLRATVAVRRMAVNEWQVLAEDVADDGFFLWDTTAHTDGRYELRIALADPQRPGEIVSSQIVYVSNQRQQQPSIVLTAPQGGELWTGLREITWQAQPTESGVLTATLSLSADAGRTWETLAEVDARAGHHVWDTVAAPPGTAHMVRVSVTEEQTTRTVTTAAPITLVNRARPPRVRVISPTAPGSAQQERLIAWIAEDPNDMALDLALSLSADDGLAWEPLIRNLEPMGEHRLDRPLDPDRTYRLAVEANDGLYAVRAYTGAFRRAENEADRPSLELPDLRQGEVWSRMTILRWRAEDPQGGTLSIDLHGSADGGATWQPLIQNLNNTGVYIWDTTTVANGTYLLRITANGEAGSRSERIGPITVRNPGRNAPAVTLLAPHGGETWFGPREILWQTSGGTAPLMVSLSYSADGGVSWRTMARALPDTGRYVWDTTTVPNAEQVWVRAIVTDGQLRAQAISAGPVTVRNPYAPIVRLLSPGDGAHWMGRQPITWRATQRTGRTTQVNIDISLDMGLSWQNLARDLPAEGVYMWDTTSVPHGSRVLVRVTASDGLDRGVDTLSRPLRIHHAPAHVPPAASPPDEPHAASDE